MSGEEGDVTDRLYPGGWNVVSSGTCLSVNQRTTHKIACSWGDYESPY